MYEQFVIGLNMLLCVLGLAYAAYRVHILPRLREQERRQSAAQHEERAAMARAAKEEMELARLRLQLAREERALAAEERAAKSGAPAPTAVPAATTAAKRETKKPALRPHLEAVKSDTTLTPAVNMVREPTPEFRSEGMSDEDILSMMDAQEAERQAG